jgi:hypothetical protein
MLFREGAADRCERGEVAGAAAEVVNANPGGVAKRNPCHTGRHGGAEEARLEESLRSICRLPVRREELPEFTGNIWQSMSEGSLCVQKG